MSTVLVQSLLFLGILFVHMSDVLLITMANIDARVHIVYMGERPHDNPEHVTSSHHNLLSSVLGSREASANSMIYSYRHGFSGFAAKLTESQAKSVAELAGVVHVSQNRFYKLRTTRSWDYLGLSSSFPTNLLHQTNFGEDTIIGVIDTGIWPESESFKDEGLGSIPSRWRGICQKGERFDPAKNCNRKLIGARFFFKGLEAELGEAFNATEFNEFLSARDANGHGTLTSSTAGGSYVHNASLGGLAYGSARGGAPHARLAIYKVAWGRGGGIIASADILKAFDVAIHDRVDVLSLSLGIGVPLYSEMDKRDFIYYGSFHAVANGITVVCAAGNSGPTAQTVTDVAPWVITVGATTIDRSFPTPIMLGNNITLMGQAMFLGKDTGFVGLIYKEGAEVYERQPNCKSLSSNDTWVSGKVVVCFTTNANDLKFSSAIKEFLSAGGLGMIVATNPTRNLFSHVAVVPVVFVSYDVGTDILNYFRMSRDPKVRLTPSKTYIGKLASTYVSQFSSRGPNSLSPAILKPDVAAPGADILAATKRKNGYTFASGTSMATPHVSGIVALLKSLHPDWSPAALRSALVTTAWTMDPNSGEPILAEGDVTRIADPFDFGGGLANPNRARDPGLVYDLGIADYTQYLCSMGYKETAIHHLTRKAKSCSGTTTSILDLNLPSITIPDLRTPVNITRTVTNVGAIYSEYKAIINPPSGIAIVVKPDCLIFSPEIKKISFTVTISTSHDQVTTKYYFGSLTWTDGMHQVRIPISVRSQFPELAW